MTISRDTFDPAKNFKRIRYHQDRDLLDSELNEQQAITHHEGKKIVDLLFKEGAILNGLQVQVEENQLSLVEGVVYLDGHMEPVSGSVLTFDPAKTEGMDYVYAEVLKYTYGIGQDGTLLNPATGEPTAEREKWIVRLQDVDTTGAQLPSNAFERRVVPIYKFDRATGKVTPTVLYTSNMYLEQFLGTLSGHRITLNSITEEQLAFAASEGLTSLLENLAERTFDQAGSYLVYGLDSFIGGDDGENVEVITNAGRAYIRGFRLQKDLPTHTQVPKSVATKSVRGEQKTFTSSQRQYLLNSKPLKTTTQVEAIVQTSANITRGSVGGGQDLLNPNPVVEILEVTQGATVFEKGSDWQQSGNYVDWLGAAEPAIGTTYTVRWTYTKQLNKGVDYVDGGWFGAPGHPAPREYFYLVTAVTAAGETGFDEGLVVSRGTVAGEVNRLTWGKTPGVTGYRIYRAIQNTGSGDFQLLAEIQASLLSWSDDGVQDLSSDNPPEQNTAGVTFSWLNIELSNLSLVNFGRSEVGEEPVEGTNLSIDYEYFIGRQDVIYATTTEIKRLEGASADFPKLPIAPEGTLPLASVDCPPDSVDMTVRNFGLTRVTMDRIHDIIKDVEDLKYNDAQFQMNNDLQNRTAQTKKGIYSDDFSSDAQSDTFHPEWSARVETAQQFVAPARETTAVGLVVDEAASNVQLNDSLALLPQTEIVLLDQPDWSEEKAINPVGAFPQPEAAVTVTPNIARRGFAPVRVRGSHFTPGGAAMIRCDGQVVGSSIPVDGAGRVDAIFVVPAPSRIGSRIVEVTDGTVSARTFLGVHHPFWIHRVERIVLDRSLQNYQGVRMFMAPRILRRPVFRTVWRWQSRERKPYPLAQTFQVDQNRVMSAVGLSFTSKGAEPITLQIRGVSNGLPNEVVLAERTLAPDEITVSGETKILFDDPVALEGEISYALVFLTKSSQYKVRVASMGRAGQQGVITDQVYEAGHLLEGKGDGWAALQGSDLTVKLYGHQFQASGVIRFEPVTGVQLTALNLDEFSTIPEGTRIIWEFSTDGGVSWDALVPAEEEALPGVATEVLIQARIEGLTSQSPALNFKDVQLVGYLNDSGGAYISRENALTQGVESTKIYTQMNIPSGTTVTWFAMNDGTTWEAMTVEDTREIDQQWTEYTLGMTFADPAGTQVRYRALLTGTPLVVPRIHTLGATLS